MTIRFEILALSIAKNNGSFDTPESTAFKNRNPLLLKTYRPEKKADSDHVRIFSTFMGGFKAGIAELTARCSGQNHRLNSENTLGDLLAMYGFNNDAAVRRICLFMQRSLDDSSISGGTKLSWFLAPENEVEKAAE